ncbi:MAG: GAF domain-containing protein [Anaerolineae bacterium]|nr:MAG: GAF domain-containing protein [Anaerolineae bacterium]
MLLRIRWGSLRTKIIVWAFVPTAIILVAVAWVTFRAYQQVTEDLVIERDQKLTRLSTGEFAAGLTEYAGLLAEYTGLLADLTRTVYFYESELVGPRDILRRARSRFEVFDGGVLILDNHGTVVATEPERSGALGQNWADRSYFRQMLRSPRTIFSDIVADGPGGAKVIVVAVPITGDQGQFLGVIAGMFHLGATAINPFYTDLTKLRLGERGSTYLVDGQGWVIYHSDPNRIGDNFSSQAVVQQVLSGEVGAVRTRDLNGREIVAGFAPVPGTAWGFVTEESWAALISPSRDYQQFLLLLLALGVAVPALVVAVGVRRIIRPISELISAAQEVAGGNFGQTITARTGDEIEELAEQFNLMAAQLQESYAHLERRVADRTKELAAINAIAAVASQSLDLNEVLNDVLDKTLQVMEIEAGGIYLLNEGQGVLTVAAHQGFSPQFVAEIDKLKVGEGFSGHVAQTGQPLVVRDVSADPRLTRMVVREEGLRSLASVPLSSKGKVRGTLFAVTHGYREFTDQDVQLLVSIGHQIGVAVDNARLFEAESRRRQEATLLAEMARLISGTLDLDEVLRLTAEYAVDVFDVHCCCVFLYDEIRGTLRPAAKIGFDPQVAATIADTEFLPGENMRRMVFETRQPLIVEDVPSDPHLNPPELLDLQSALVVPIEVGGQRLGALQLGTRHPRRRRFTAEEGELALAMANQAAVAIENARLFEAEQRRVEQFRVISEVGHRVTSILAIDELLAQMTRLIKETFDYHGVGIGLIEGDRLAFRTGAGSFWEDPQFQPLSLKVGQEGITGWVAGTGEPLLVSDVSQEPRYYLPPLRRATKTRSELAIPMKVKGTVIGVLDVESDRLNAFDESDLAVLQSLANQAAIAIENARLFRDATRQVRELRALTDASRIISSVLDRDQLLQALYEQITRIAPTDFYAIALYDQETNVVSVEINVDEGVHYPKAQYVLDKGLLKLVIHDHQPLRFYSLTEEKAKLDVEIVPAGSPKVNHGWLGVPMLYGDKVVGALVVGSYERGAFDEGHQQILTSIANQAAVALENARLYEQAQQLAILQERQRLARDLHDAVTQTLFSASLIAEVLPAHWENDQDSGRQLLQELRQLSRGAMAEMRTLLLELRPAALVEAGLGDLLRQLGEAVTGRKGIPVALMVEGECAIPDDVHVALYRIAQEALNNVVKHANASQVAVSLRCIPSASRDRAAGAVELCISDDGRGFDPDGIPPDRLGLGIIRERAQAIGATLKIDSQSGYGTQVKVRWEEDEGRRTKDKG